MNPWDMLLDQQPPSNYIAPLFWQHGEIESILREEIIKMREGGIGAFIVESRPHPDFLGPRWWHDLDVILDEAGKQGMQVWLFDDKDYPSGFAAGLLKDTHPEYLKIYLAERHIDAIGPLRGSSFLIAPWLEEGDALIRVIAARQIDRGDILHAESLVDLTSLVSEGILYWDVPDGDWRVFILFSTRRGGEEHTANYLNPLEPAPVRAYLDIMHEEHYKRYAGHFGKTIAGFFTDEPRFGNHASYTAPLGTLSMVLPFSNSLLSFLDDSWGGDFSLLLPLLWYESAEQVGAGKVSARARFTYMDVVSRLFSTCFLGQMGDWCRSHGVKLIGHVVEENGAHARLGYGAGHFFRAMEALDAGGLDVVYHIWPGFTSGNVSWAGTTSWDARFAYWGMAKMASSAAHIDPKKDGLTICETFGAYGWQEGLKLMKWITDHLVVRGVNYIIPHAFSPRYNDPDCPPHFYSRGANPQWPYYHLLSEYTNRICHLLSGGEHIAPVAVLYHAEGEWAGEYEPFEEAVRILLTDQIDCDVLPIDVLIDPERTHIHEGCFSIHRETYKALVIPYAVRLPQTLMAVLVKMIHQNVPIIFTGDLPHSSSQNGGGFDELLSELTASPNTAVCSTDLVEYIRYLGLPDIELSSPQPALRYLHYQQETTSLYFFTNESRNERISTIVTLSEPGTLVAYDALYDRMIGLDYAQEEGRVKFSLELDPYESLFILFQKEGLPPFVKRLNPTSLNNPQLIDSSWKVSSAPNPAGPFQVESRLSGPGNAAQPGLLPRFSGTLRYETSFSIQPGELGEPTLLDLGEVYETAEVILNGKPLGVRICPPYHFDVTNILQDGQYELVILVTNTLAKARGLDNPFDRAMPQEPTGLLGPVQIRR